MKNKPLSSLETILSLATFLEGSDKTLTITTKLTGDIVCILTIDRDNARKQLDYLITEWQQRQVERAKLEKLKRDNILAGLVMGLNESVPDLLKQTELVIRHMVAISD